MVVLFVFLELR